jgi:putative ATP-dependent endonuclease of OLD family
VPVSVITDADPQDITDDQGKKTTHYPKAGEAIVLSDNAALMKAREDVFVKVFHGVKTFEYDFSLSSKNRAAMLAGLKEIHPGIGADVEVLVNAAADERAKAEALFRGMFERPSNNVQKGKFAQALAAKITDDQMDVDVPDYIIQAVKHACQT